MKIVFNQHNVICIILICLYYVYYVGTVFLALFSKLKFTSIPSLIL